MKPPSGGPMIGPTMAGTVRYAKAAIISERGTERMTSTRPTGSIIAPPRPCTTRANTKPVSVSASPQKIEPATKTASAAPKMLRPPKRSAIQALAGTNTA